jgi:disulfide bond formation protein DsbB
MTQEVIVGLAAAGVVAQGLCALLLLACALALTGVRKPLRALRSLIWGYELWLAFCVSATATAGSLFLSEVAHFVPCELCWFQRIFMYPLAIVTLMLALRDDNRAAAYLLPLPVLGAGFSVYHLLVENGAVGQTNSCLASAPGGCATKWIDEFGFVTIPTLALTAFALSFAFLMLAVLEEEVQRPTNFLTRSPAEEFGDVTGKASARTSDGVASHVRTAITAT